MNVTVLNAAMVVLAWVASGLIAYGFLKAKTIDFERRITQLEDRHNDFVTRVEYDNRHQDLIRQLTRIESTIDRRTKNRQE